MKKKAKEKKKRIKTQAQSETAQRVRGRGVAEWQQRERMERDREGEENGRTERENKRPFPEPLVQTLRSSSITGECCIAHGRHSRKPVSLLSNTSSQMSGRYGDAHDTYIDRFIYTSKWKRPGLN